MIKGYDRLSVLLFLAEDKLASGIEYEGVNAFRSSKPEVQDFCRMR